MSELPKRKPNRLVNYDYSMPGCYFVTVCTKDKSCILGTVRASEGSAQASVQLSELGRWTDEAVRAIPSVYSGVTLDTYVVMPNHIHLLLRLSENGTGLPSLSRIIQQTKRRVSRLAERPIWQEHFHDHIVRGEEDYLEIRQYIANNPAKWNLDRYHRE